MCLRPPLERVPPPRFLKPVLRERVERGLVAGGIAAAATGGALLGLGRARGATVTLLNDAAHIFIGERARLVESPHLLVTSLAMLVHLGSLLLWGVLFTLAAASLRGWRLALAAIAFAGAMLAADVLLLPESLRPGFETAMTLPELILLYAIVAASLAVGVAATRRRSGVA